MSFPLKQTLNELRKNQTLVETLLWEKLKNRKLDGHRFIRQFPIKHVFEETSRFFIADFYCSKYRLVIELDGNSHQEKKEHDDLRDLIMEHQNIIVLRFTNIQALHHMNELLSTIKKTLLKLPSLEQRGVRGWVLWENYVEYNSNHIKKLHTHTYKEGIMKLEKFAENSINGLALSNEDANAILDGTSVNLLELLNQAYQVRKNYFGNEVRIHILNNAKNGKCPEDCSYCVQAKSSEVPIEDYSFKDEEEILNEAKRAYEAGAYRYCMVFAGRGPTKFRVQKLAGIIKKIKETYPIQVCLSTGLLSQEDTDILKEVNLDRLNHNLNTSEDFYPSICTTHTYQDRLNTLKAAQKSGLQICSGIIVGMGETNQDIVDVAMKLRELKAESIPINFYMYVEGNQLGPKAEELNPEKCLRILALFRLLNPNAEIRMAAGREIHLRSMQALGLYPANSLFMDGYLNTIGTNPFQTLQMIQDAGFTVTADKGLEELLSKFENAETTQSNPQDASSKAILKSLKELRPTAQAN